MAPPHAAARPSLSTPQRVRDRLGADAAVLSDALLQDLIAEQQGAVEAKARRTFAPTDDGFTLACSATTNLAAAMALAHLKAAAASNAEYSIGKLDVRKSAQVKAWTTLLQQLRLAAQEALDILERDARSRRFTLLGV